MNTPHKYAEVIKAWADGTAVQCRCLGSDVSWSHYPSNPTRNWCPIGDTNYEWRIKPQPHKWQKEMDAFAAGKSIQYRQTNLNQRWYDVTNQPLWSTGPHDEYRIKPEEVVRYMTVGTSLYAAFRMHKSLDDFELRHQANLKLTFEDGKLVKAEVI